MEDIDIEWLALFGIIMAILMLIFSWLWANTTMIRTASTFANGLYVIFAVIFIITFGAIAFLKKR